MNRDILEEENLSRIELPSPIVAKKEYQKWTRLENRLYINFLQKNIEEEKRRKRKPRSYFVKMSNFMGGLKTNEQCRSHHRKMLLTHSTISKIIAHVKKREEALEAQQSTQIVEESSQSLIGDFMQERKERECELKEIPWECFEVQNGLFELGLALYPSIF